MFLLFKNTFYVHDSNRCRRPRRRQRWSPGGNSRAPRRPRSKQPSRCSEESKAATWLARGL